MKNVRKIGHFFSLLAMGMLVSCISDSELDNSVNGDNGKKVKMNVGVSVADGLIAKSLGELDNKTGNVKNVHIYVFRENGDLDISTNATRISDIELKVTQGKREFFAVANPQAEFTDITRKSPFLEVISKLENEKSDALTMVGTTGVVDVKEGGDTNINITVERLTARIQLQYDVNFTGTPWEGKEFIPDSVYITNAYSKASVNSVIGGDVTTEPLSGGWFGKTSYLCDVATRSWGQTPVPIGGDKWLSYYVYKNDDPASDKFKDVTSLVICGHIEGVEDIQYYTVRINTPESNIVGGDDEAKHQYVQNNVIYSIKATIKGSGTPEPGVDPINFHVNVTPEKWKEIHQEVEFQ